MSYKQLNSTERKHCWLLSILGIMGNENACWPLILADLFLTSESVLWPSPQTSCQGRVPVIPSPSRIPRDSDPRNSGNRWWADHTSDLFSFWGLERETGLYSLWKVFWKLFGITSETFRLETRCLQSDFLIVQVNWEARSEAVKWPAST